MNRFLFGFLIFLSSCSGFFNKKTERPVARVYKDFLYESDLKGVVQKGSSPRDSLMVTRAYIDNWIRRKLILHQAEKNLADSELDFSKQLENYRNSLITFEYENTLIRQKLDTVITDEDITTYYNTNQNLFSVRETILRMQYVKLPVKSRYIPQARNLLLSDKQEDQNRLADLCDKQSFGYFMNNDQWLFFSDLARDVPLKTTDPDDFLKKNRQVEVSDPAFTWLIRFMDYRLRGSTSPLELEKQKIHDIILNRRKMELISKMHDYIYQNALKQNDFEVF